MKKFIYTALIAAISFGATAQKIDRSKAPVPGPAPKINIGQYEKFELDNGLKVILVENHKLPKVSFQLTVDMDPLLEGDKVGFSDMAGNLISAGTTTKTKAQIDEETDFIGATLSTSSNGIYASSLKKHSEKLLTVVSDMIMNPAFPQEELDKLKKQAKSGLKSAKTNADVIISNVGKVLRNGSDHPYGELQDASDIDNITIEDCKQFYKTYFRPNISYLVIVGDLNKEEAEKMAKQYFGSWEKATVPSHKYDTPKANWDTRVAFVNKPGAVQSVINVTYPVDLKPGDADELPARVMNAILGGGVFSGRLMQNLREDKAYTYGARSSLSSGKLVGSFKAYASVRNDVTDSSVTEFMSELEKMVAEKVTEDEISLIKNNMNGTFALSLESPQTIARFALNIERYGLPANYYETYLERLAAITIDDIQAVAKKYIRPQNAIILVVGNKDECADKLNKFASSGKVEFFDYQGNVVINKPKKELPAGLTAEQVINDYVMKITNTSDIKSAAKKFKKIKTKKTVMGAEMEQMGQKFNIEMTTLSTSKGQYAMSINAMGMNVAQTVFDGKDGFNKNMQTGKKEMDEAEKQEMRENASFCKELKLKEMGYQMKLTGIEEIEGKDTYKVELVDEAGDKSYLFFGVDSKLKVQEMGSEEGPDGSVTTVSSVLSDYKEVSGIMFPHSRAVTQGEQDFEFKVSKMIINSKDKALKTEFKNAFKMD